MTAIDAGLNPSEPRISWINGWRRTHHGLRLETVVRHDHETAVEQTGASLLLTRSQAFDNVGGTFSGAPWEVIRIEIDDLSRMLSLRRPPGGEFRRTVPRASSSRHVVFVAEGSGGTAYLPAALLIRELWLWSADALDALLTPASIELFLSLSCDHDELTLDAGGPFARAKGANLRRLSWLAQCSDARESWASVLTYANAGALGLRLPRASMVAWGIGVPLQHGILVSRLASSRIGFSLPIEGAPMRIRGKVMRCPHPPEWRSDPQPNFWHGSCA
jgi:hypothetical protein